MEGAGCSATVSMSRFSRYSRVAVFSFAQLPRRRRKKTWRKPNHPTPQSRGLGKGQKEIPAIRSAVMPSRFPTPSDFPCREKSTCGMDGQWRNARLSGILVHRMVPREANFREVGSVLRSSAFGRGVGGAGGREDKRGKEGRQRVCYE